VLFLWLCMLDCVAHTLSRLGSPPFLVPCTHAPNAHWTPCIQPSSCPTCTDSTKTQMMRQVRRPVAAEERQGSRRLMTMTLRLRISKMMRTILDRAGMHHTDSATMYLIKGVLKHWCLICIHNFQFLVIQELYILAA